MGLLQNDERQYLIEGLLRLPNIRETGVRRQLVAGLPENLRNTMSASDVPQIEVGSIVEVADGDVWGQLPDGSWSIIKVIENSVVLVRGSKLGAELETLLNTLKQRAIEQAAPKSTPSSAPTGQLTGEQRKKLHEALLSAFPDQRSLEVMLYFSLNINLNQITTPGSLYTMAAELIQWAEAQGKVKEMVYGALRENPGNETLRTFAEEMGLVASSPVTPPQPPTESAPETPTKGAPGSGFIDFESLRARMSEAEPTVCRVELSEQGAGTGFLVGPSVAMTSYHVVNRFIENPSQPQAITLRFGYKMSPDGMTIYQGQVYHLADNWLIDSDKTLDFALLRVARSPGDEPVGNQPGAPPRRWLNPKVNHTFQPGDPMFMIQHPQAGPLKIAYEPESIVSVNPELTRVTYRMSTAPGSAGAPCFTDKWELIALHHSTDKSRDVGFGTTMRAIASRPKVKTALGT